MLWERLGGVCDSLHHAGLEAWHLQRVLGKKRDPLSHVLLLDVVSPPDQDSAQLPLDAFWCVQGGGSPPSKQGLAS